MARIVLNGAMVQDMHGSMGSAVVSKWKGLHYIRLSSPNISNSRTAPQMKMRNGLVSSLIGWRGLTPAQRAQWEEYAQAQGSMSADDSQVGSKGIIPSPSRTQAGVNAFIGVNQRLRSIDLIPVVIPPLYSLQGGQVVSTDIVGGELEVEVHFPPDSLEVGDVVRLWGRGEWSASHSYIVKSHPLVIADIVPGVIISVIFTVGTWRLGHGHHIVEVPTTDLLGRLFRFQCDVLRPDGSPSPASNIAELLNP